MELQTHSCDICGERFQAACLKELQEKLRKHKCVKTNKRAERTAQLKQARVDQFVRDVAIDRIHQHKFDELIQQGMVVNA